MATAHSPRDLDRWFTALDINPAARSVGAGPAGDVMGPDPDDGFELDEPGPAPDWADSLDDQFTEMARDRQAAAADTQRRRNRWRYTGILVAGVSVVAGSAVWSTTPDSPQAFSSNTAASPAATTSAMGSSSPTTASAGECPSQVSGDVVTGADHGGTDSGPHAILAFEAAYYLDRSGTKAREVTTAEAAVPPAQAIQQGIDTVPRGTTHCVTITPTGLDTYAIDLTETRPDTGTTVYRQTITTTHRDGRVLITGITPR